MNIEILREYALQKPLVTESFPFGETVLVFKVNNKIFLLISLDTETLRFNVKCNPDKAIELRESNPMAIFPGFHMNKKHWNTVVVNGKLSNQFILNLIDDSYNLIANKIKSNGRNI